MFDGFYMHESGFPESFADDKRVENEIRVVQSVRFINGVAAVGLEGKWTGTKVRRVEEGLSYVPFFSSHD